MPWAAKDKLETAVLWHNSHIETFPRLVHSDELLFLCLLLATCRRTQTNSHTTYSTRPSGGPLRRTRSSKTVQWLQIAAGSVGGCKPAPSESPPRLTLSYVRAVRARVIAHQFASSLPSSFWGGISSSLNRCTTVPFASLLLISARPSPTDVRIAYNLLCDWSRVTCIWYEIKMAGKGVRSGEAVGTRRWPVSASPIKKKETREPSSVVRCSIDHIWTSW